MSAWSRSIRPQMAPAKFWAAASASLRLNSAWEGAEKDASGSISTRAMLKRVITACESVVKRSLFAQFGQNHPRTFLSGEE